MATCSDGSCSCRIVAGEGINVTGSGTLTNPYAVASDFTGLTDSFQVNDTPTVNLTLRGAGNPTDPFVLQADSALRLTQLTDVSDPEGGPAVGESPVWVGTGSAGHWEFKIPTTAPAGSVNVGAGIAGTGAAGTPIKVKLVSETPGATTGLAVYVDTVGNLRTAPPVATAVDWSAIVNKPSAFPPSAHTHVAANITDPQNFTGALSVGNALKVMNHQIFTGSTTPAGPVQGDLWFKRA